MKKVKKIPKNGNIIDMIVDEFDVPYVCASGCKYNRPGSPGSLLSSISSSCPLSDDTLGKVCTVSSLDTGDNMELFCRQAFSGDNVLCIFFNSLQYGVFASLLHSVITVL